MFQYYQVSEGANGVLTLKVNAIDLRNYKLHIEENGDIIAKPRTEIMKIDVLQSETDISFSNSKILSCSINNETFENITYKALQMKIYYIIGNGSKIIKDKLNNINIVTIEKKDKGFIYDSNLGISIQGSCSDNLIKEVVSQSKKNGIKLSTTIQLKDKRCILVET
jgi:hypothetical protein